MQKEIISSGGMHSLLTLFKSCGGNRETSTAITNAASDTTSSGVGFDIGKLGSF